MDQASWREFADLLRNLDSGQLEALRAILDAEESEMLFLKDVKDVVEALRGEVRIKGLTWCFVIFSFEPEDTAIIAATPLQTVARGNFRRDIRYHIGNLLENHLDLVNDLLAD